KHFTMRKPCGTPFRFSSDRWNSFRSSGLQKPQNGVISVQRMCMMEPESPVLGPARRLQRLERRLDIVGKLCRHDLPNQLVVIRGPVSLLQEEGPKLGPEGQEYTSRLSRAAERALDMMQSLKILLAVDSLADEPEEIDLDDLAKEWTREIRQL